LHGRVCVDNMDYSLAVSRSMGDRDAKRNKAFGPKDQIVTCSHPSQRLLIEAFPDVEEHLCVDGDEFVVIASDGMFGIKTS